MKTRKELEVEMRNYRSEFDEANRIRKPDLAKKWKARLASSKKLWEETRPESEKVTKVVEIPDKKASKQVTIKKSPGRPKAKTKSKDKTEKI